MADKTEHQGKKPAARRGTDRADPVRPDPVPDDAKTGDVSQPETAKDKAGNEGFSDPLAFLNAELERMETEKADLQEQILRMAAEMENLRKRTRKDVADARAYSIAGFAREMLGVADNLGRALDAVSNEARESADASLATLIEGVELTGKSMQQALEKSGVLRISPLNERFDPHFHQAMYEIPDAEVPNNTVLQVVQDGYVIGDRVLRPAMVGVSRGGPKRPAAGGDQSGNGQAEESPQAGRGADDA